MRIQDKVDLVISRDVVNEPNQIRLKEVFTDTDIINLKEVALRQETFPVGTHVISLGNITQGKFLYLKPTQDVGVEINGLAAITFRAGKATRMWANVTSLSIVVSTDPQEVLIAVAGE